MFSSKEADCRHPQSRATEPLQPFSFDIYTYLGVSYVLMSAVHHARKVFSAKRTPAGKVEMNKPQTLDRRVGSSGCNCGRVGVLVFAGSMAVAVEVVYEKRYRASRLGDTALSSKRSWR